MALNKAGQAEARRRAMATMFNSPTVDAARQRAYAVAMWALSGRNRREQRIADEAQRIVDAEAVAYFAKKPGY